MLQRQPIQKLHDEERMAVLLSNFMDRANIRVIQCRRGLGFSLEPSQCLGVFGYFIGQELQGDKSVQGYVLGLIDHAHATASELLDDAVVRDGLADHSQECYGGWPGMSMSSEAATLASRTGPWLASGWGCRGRRLSRGRGSLCRQSLLWRCHLPSHTRARVGAEPVRPTDNSLLRRDGQQTSGIRQRLLSPDVAPGKPFL